MRVPVIVAVMVLSLSIHPGCRERPKVYGNFANVESADLVHDALTAMLAAYPPAKTRLNLLHEAGDMFGFRLIESMRGNGYAVAEYAGPAKGGKKPAVVDSPSGLGFGYILDRLKDSDELRVTLRVGDETLSRMYQVQGAAPQYVPVGSWVRRQKGESHAGE